jgi:anthranilate synthase/aminodeoxychorismate synthase-like glutamine amidotransferase
MYDQTKSFPRTVRQISSIEFRVVFTFPMIILIDNYDSFVHNLARYLRRLGQETTIVRNDAVTPRDVLNRRPSAIVLSPGPCTPTEAGCSLNLVRQAAGRIPILGVCLGHQTIAAAFGGMIVRAPAPMHGRTSEVQHNRSGIFQNVPNPLVVGRYHSLVADRDTLPVELEVTAVADGGVIMALAHRQWPIFGVQFHPESILTEGGYDLLGNFLRLAGIQPSPSFQAMDSERPLARPSTPLPTGPVTF